MDTYEAITYSLHTNTKDLSYKTGITLQVYYIHYYFMWTVYIRLVTRICINKLFSSYSS